MLHRLGIEKGFLRTFFTLAMPVMLQNLINNALAMTDTFMLGFLGENEIAAATLANTPFFVLNLLVFGLQSGASVLFCQYWGRRDTLSINKILGVGLYASVFVTIIFSSVCFSFAPQITGVLTRDPVVASLAADYMRIVAFSCVLNSVTLVYLSAQRSMENPKIGLFILTSSMILNTFLNYILIFGNFGAPALGVSGAAIATSISRVVELCIAVIYALFISKRLRLKFNALLRPGREFIGDFLRYAGPVVANETVWGLGFSLYTVIFSLMGKGTLSAFTVAGNIERVLSSLNFGYAAAAGVIVGREVGAGRPESAYKSGRAMNILALIGGLILGALLFLLYPLILPAFNISDSTKALAGDMLLVLCLVLPVRSIILSNLIGVLRAGGDTRMVMAMDIGFMWAICLPLAWAFGLWFGLPPIFVFLMPVLEDVLKLIFGLWRFKTKKWIRNITRGCVERT